MFDTFGDNDGTAVNSPLFGADYGKYLHGADFVRASSQRIDLPLIHALATDFTWSLWLRRPAVASGAYTVMALTRNSSFNPYYWLSGTDQNNVLVTRSDTASDLQSITAAYTTNQWHHIAVTHQADTRLVQMYQDGQFVGSHTRVAAITVDRLTIGARRAPAVDNHLQGQIDEVAIFNRVLSSNEVSEIYNNGKGRFYTP